MIHPHSHVASLLDLRRGVDMDKHNIDDGDAKLAALDAALAALAPHPTGWRDIASEKGGWISVHTRLPEVGEWVNVLLDRDEGDYFDRLNKPRFDVYGAQLREVDTEGYATWQRWKMPDGGPICPLYLVTYWQPLPAPYDTHPAEHPPENIRDGAPYNDPAFESLAREHAVLGTAQSALCAVFWNAAKGGQQEGGDAALGIEAAAKMLAERMDYPWESMPEKGRGHMRKHAQAVIDAAMTKGVDACEGEGNG